MLTIIQLSRPTTSRNCGTWVCAVLNCVINRLQIENKVLKPYKLRTLMGKAWWHQSMYWRTLLLGRQSILCTIVIKVAKNL